MATTTPAVKTSEEREKIIYIYRCPECGKFYEENCRNDGLICSCGTHTVMSTPEFTIKHYKKTRFLSNMMTIFFSIILPILTLSLFMFVNKTEPEAATPEKLSYKLPILFLILVGTIILKGKPLIDKIAANTTIVPIKCVLVFISKTSTFLIIIGILGVLVGSISKSLELLNDVSKALIEMKASLLNIIYALVTVVIEITIAYCVFDTMQSKADYLIRRALRQSETIQAMEMSGR